MSRANPTGKLSPFTSSYSATPPSGKSAARKSVGPQAIRRSVGKKQAATVKTTVQAITPSKPRRVKPGSRVLREIRKFQNTHHILLPKLPFARVVLFYFILF